MPALSRNAQVLRYILQVAPGLGRTLLMKFAYLADCEARRFLGEQVSQFDYVRYNHGPFDQGLYAAIDELKDAGLIDGSRVTFPNGYEGYQYTPTDLAVSYDFEPAESAVLDYVARTYMGKTARELCDEVVYETPPMKEEGLKMGRRLKMKLMDVKDRSGFGFDLKRLVQSEKSARSGRHRSLAEAMDDLLVTSNS